MDKFEKHIRNNREALDGSEPSDMVWEKIAAKLDEQQPKRQVQLVPITRLWQVAAVFLGLVVSMAAFQIYYNMQTEKTLVARVENSVNLESINPSLAEAEQFYFMQIEEKRGEVKKYSAEGVKADSEAEKYMAELDIAYKDLKKELLTNSNELVVSEMVRNLQIRMDLLNQQLEVLKQIEKAKEQKEGETL
jgi:hypothetical protein